MENAGVEFHFVVDAGEFIPLEVGQDQVADFGGCRTAPHPGVCNA
jgi:hypothetical protein